MLKEAKVHSWDFPSINLTHMCAVQAPQTLGWGSGKGGPGESLSGASCPSLPKNQDDFLRPCWRFSHGGSVYRPGNIYLFFFFSPPIWQQSCLLLCRIQYSDICATVTNVARDASKTKMAPPYNFKPTTSEVWSITFQFNAKSNSVWYWQHRSNTDTLSKYT